jgi:hypothetical protein
MQDEMEEKAGYVIGIITHKRKRKIRSQTPNSTKKKKKNLYNSVFGESTDVGASQLLYRSPSLKRT